MLKLITYMFWLGGVWGGGGGVVLVHAPENTISEHFQLFFSSLHFFRLVFGEGTSETPHFTSRRCIVLLILLFGFLIFQFYSASIVGSLLMEKPKTIKTLRNLIDSALDVGIEDIVYIRDFFRVSTKWESKKLVDFQLSIGSNRPLFMHKIVSLRFQHSKSTLPLDVLALGALVTRRSFSILFFLWLSLLFLPVFVSMALLMFTRGVKCKSNR